MNEHLNVIFLSLSSSLPSQYVNLSKNEPINGHALQYGKLILQLTHCACIWKHCACIWIRFNCDTFSTERSPNYDTSNRKSIETRGYLICTRGRSPRVLIRLPSVLMFFLFCIIVKHKNTFPVVTIWNPGKKVTYEQASECDISVTFIFSAVTICKPQQKWANQWACSGVRVTYTCTPVNALIMHVYVFNLTLTHFQQKSPQTMIQVIIQCVVNLSYPMLLGYHTVYYARLSCSKVLIQYVARLSC
jgi:hypothetical protein